MTEVFNSYFQEEILVLKSLLDSTGIESAILDGSMSTLAPFYTIDSGGYRLVVGEEDAEDARALIADHRERRAAGEAPSP